MASFHDSVYNTETRLYSQGTVYFESTKKTILSEVLQTVLRGRVLNSSAIVDFVPIYGNAFSWVSGNVDQLAP